MKFRLVNARSVACLVVSGFMLAAAGCQSGDGASGALESAGQDAPPPPGKVLESDLRAFCPTVTLREGTAYFNTYEKNAQGDAGKIIYQASISDVTRSCSRADGTLTVNVAVAGRVVPGPVGRSGTITMPIRIAAIRGDEILYSKLHDFQVTIADAGSATQFVFNDPNVTMPLPDDRSIRIFAGYDEGPAKKLAASQ